MTGLYFVDLFGPPAAEGSRCLVTGSPRRPKWGIVRTALAAAALAATPAIGGLMGDLSITGPQRLTQCENATITWQGGIPPYNISWMPYDDAASLLVQNASLHGVVKTLDSSWPGTNYTWKVDAPATLITFMVTSTDNSADEADFKMYNVLAGNDTSCLAAGSSTSRASGAGTGTPAGFAADASGIADAPKSLGNSGSSAASSSSASMTSVNPSDIASAFSAGAEAGIAVGAILAGIALGLGVGVYLLIRRRRRRRAKAQNTAQTDNDSPAPEVDPAPAPSPDPVVTPFHEDEKGYARLNQFFQREWRDIKRPRDGMSSPPSMSPPSLSVRTAGTGETSTSSSSTAHATTPLLLAPVPAAQRDIAAPASPASLLSHHGWSTPTQTAGTGWTLMPSPSTQTVSTGWPWTARTSTSHASSPVFWTQIPAPSSAPATQARQAAPQSAQELSTPAEPPTIVEHEVDGGPVVSPRRELLPPVYNPQWNQPGSD